MELALVVGRMLYPGDNELVGKPRACKSLV